MPIDRSGIKKKKKKLQFRDKEGYHPIGVSWKAFERARL